MPQKRSSSPSRIELHESGKRHQGEDVKNPAWTPALRFADIQRELELCRAHQAKFNGIEALARESTNALGLCTADSNELRKQEENIERELGDAVAKRALIERFPESDEIRRLEVENKQLENELKKLREQFLHLKDMADTLGRSPEEIQGDVPQLNQQADLGTSRVRPAALGIQQIKTDRAKEPPNRSLKERLAEKGEAERERKLALILAKDAKSKIAMKKQTQMDTEKSKKKNETSQKLLEAYRRKILNASVQQDRFEAGNPTVTDTTSAVQKPAAPLIVEDIQEKADDSKFSTEELAAIKGDNPERYKRILAARADDSEFTTAELAIIKAVDPPRHKRILAVKKEKQTAAREAMKGNPEAQAMRAAYNLAMVKEMEAEAEKNKILRERKMQTAENT